MTRKTKDYLLFGTIIFLVLALSVSVFGFVVKTNDLNDAKAKIKENQSAFAEEKAGLEERIKQAEDAKAATESELNTTKQAKESLESENSRLKKEITELKAKKAAVAKYLNKTAVAQNPQPTGKVCYLTFDDGPSANTLKILDILAQYNVKATFFVVNNAQTKIQYVKQIHAAGHTIGLHSSSHVYSQIYKNTDSYFADLNALSAKVKELTGVESKVIRFPGGSSNSVSKNYCRGIMTALSHMVTEKGYTYFDWNVSSEDASAARVSASKITYNVLQGARNKNSICVLMHDAAGKTTTVDALPGIIEGLIVQGFSFAPLTAESYGYHHGINN